MKFTVDRIEGNIAVCELEDGSFKDFLLSELPEDTKEGSIIEIKDSKAVLCNDEEKEKRRKNFNKLNKLFSKNSLQ